ncbi:hypothetical protein ACFOY2_08190 [Nonomuraea purpurea]|uniref:DUF1579 domain-containing protein n=1 Tax=Nonomuraea purpurea TaxID=1849276 RepID=A0ABV8G3S9_9ACTN
MVDKGGKGAGLGRRVALVAAAGALALGSVAGLAGSASGDTQRLRTPVGTWAVDIKFASSPKTERALFALRPDGSFTMTDGKRTGLGTWQLTSGGFKYAFRHYNLTAEGAFDWELRGVQDGQLTSADAFTSTGTGTSVDAEGNVQGVFQTQVTAKRYSIQSP